MDSTLTGNGARPGAVPLIVLASTAALCLVVIAWKIFPLSMESPFLSAILLLCAFLIFTSTSLPTGSKRLFSPCGFLFWSYLFYMFFPVDSPFYLAPDLAEPLTGNFFYELVHFVSDRGGARGGAFPSSHVSVSVTVWLVVWFRARRWAYLLTPVTVGLIFATVYGRFHYVLDSIVGLALALSIAGTYFLFRHKRE